MAHSSSGHPPTHTLVDPSETSSKALGQLATSSVEHAGKCRKLAGGKHSSNLSTSGEYGAAAGLSPGDLPSSLHFVMCATTFSPAIAVAFKNEKDLAYSHLKFIVLHFGDEANKDDTQLFYPKQRRSEG